MAQPNKVVFERKSLRKWIELEEARSKIGNTFKTKVPADIAEAIYAYLQSALKEDRPVRWDDLNSVFLFALYLEAFALNSPNKEYPILKAHTENKEPLPWEYPGRAWYFWLNLLSKQYGWDIEYISNLDLDDAIGLYQEIEIDMQLNREWEWGLTELAYPYDTTIKAGKFKPLPRPNWMMPIVPKPKVVRIRKDMLPIGNIAGNEELGQAVDAERNT